MRKRIRALVIALLGLTAAAVLVAPSADAYGGCTPRVEWDTLEIYMVC